MEFDSGSSFLCNDAETTVESERKPILSGSLGPKRSNGKTRIVLRLPGG